MKSRPIKFDDIRIGDHIGYKGDNEAEVVIEVHPFDETGSGQLNFQNGNTCPAEPDTEFWWFGFEPGLANPWSPGMGDHDKWAADYEAARQERL